MLNFNYTNAAPFLAKNELAALQAQLQIADKALHDGSNLGSDFLGWVDLPTNYDQAELDTILQIAERLRKEIDCLVVIGIGGSYLGARAVHSALAQSLTGQVKNSPELLFAGFQLSGDYMNELLHYLEGKRFAINVISKSGTTTEPAVSFRILRSLLEKQVGAEKARSLIFATTDAHKGALKQFSTDKGYQTFVVPDNVGGRFTVLTAVGLFPLAVAGIDVKKLLEGAKSMQDLCAQTKDLTNPSWAYAALRNSLYRQGKGIEILVNYDLRLNYFSEWWKQLFGESEGKFKRGIFPASVSNTTDLHSMGQFIQEGKRAMFETVLWVNKSNSSCLIPNDPDNIDGLNFLSGKELQEVNHKAMQGTAIAHVDGGVPNSLLTIDSISEYDLGQMIYFFEYAVGLSGYLNAVNPFDQPGVELYKQNMYALIGKPGFEERKQELEARLAEQAE